MTKSLKRNGLAGLPPESGYQKYFGYHPKIRDISETYSDTNKLGETKLGGNRCGAY